MDGEARGELPTQPADEAAGERGEGLAGSGWTTAKQAAKVLGVSRRSVQGYVRRGILEAQEEGEGVTKRFIVSIDSLNALRERRNDEPVAAEEFAGASAEAREAANLAANAGEGLRHVVDRLEARTAEATELRVRLEITEAAESTGRAELAEERRRREGAGGAAGGLAPPGRPSGGCAWRARRRPSRPSGRSWPRSAAGGRRPSGSARISGASSRRSRRRENPPKAPVLPRPPPRPPKARTRAHGPRSGGAGGAGCSRVEEGDEMDQESDVQEYSAGDSVRIRLQVEHEFEFSSLEAAFEHENFDPTIAGRRGERG